MYVARADAIYKIHSDLDAAAATQRVCVARQLRGIMYMARSETIYRSTPIWMQRLLLNGYALHRHWYGLGSPYRAASLQVRLGDGVSTEITHADETAPERSGKFRWVVSEVDAGYAPAWDRYTSTASTPPHA
jgi:hypothetical protein